MVAAMTVTCFMVEATGDGDAWLRRYVRGPCPTHPSKDPTYSLHEAMHYVGVIPLRFGMHDGHEMLESHDPDAFEGWEKVAACSCGYEFRDVDTRQVLCRQLWEAQGGERRILPGGREAGRPKWGPGAMCDAWWLHDWERYAGPDGRSLMVICPDGAQWTIDGQASNCTRKGDDHDCWCRHGEPPVITVDKTPEPGRSTCQAGGGSIDTGHGYHGFLRDGRFTPSL